jgi:hypothetical protein
VTVGDGASTVAVLLSGAAATTRSFDMSKAVYTRR